ncbi:MAG TPA: helix-turn-helix transcriptional regulator [Vicinamibacterales bacterium]|jgi:transcriptional regulator with XRE-family HTH domain|nr:helix-turn-helix transcriptional regulator [Vicinamibacterales bacterium]
MSAQEAFGPNLRRARLQAGVSLRTIVEATNVSEALWEGLERNDFSRWPNGIFARAFVREYAQAIGADPEATVDEFCRWFPQGERRAEPELRVSAEIVNHQLEWQDHVPAVVKEDRRGSPSPTPDARSKRPEGLFAMVARVRRVFERA